MGRAGRPVPGVIDLPRMVAGHVRRLGFDLGKIERAGAWPNILEQTVRLQPAAPPVVDDAQRPAAQTCTRPSI